MIEVKLDSGIYVHWNGERSFKIFIPRDDQFLGKMKGRQFKNRSSPVLATCETSQALLVGVPGVFFAGFYRFRRLI